MSQPCYKLTVNTGRAADVKCTCYPSIDFSFRHNKLLVKWIYILMATLITIFLSNLLQDDFLLRHYDKGPCKNKLGHSRASVIWHRAQVIGIFAGFGILLLVASPLLLLTAPCIVCCKCRVCSGSSKLDTEDEMHEESTS
jgi:hypothetical protein